MSFHDLDITRILEDLEEQYNVIVEPQQSTIQALTPPRPKKCCLEACKKKLLLSDYPCKCSRIFCSAHRIPEVHACTYDFKSAGREELKKKIGSAVIAKKLDTI